MTSRSSSVWLSAVVIAAASLTILLFVRQQRERSSRRQEDHDDDPPSSRLKQVNGTVKTTTARDVEISHEHPIREVHLNGAASLTSATSPSTNDSTEKARILERGSITIAHGSVTGKCETFARQLYATLEQIRQQQAATTTSNKKTAIQSIQIGTTEEWDWWDEFINDEDEQDDMNNSNKNNKQDLPPALLILLLPTYTDGTWTPISTALESALKDLQNDWRIAKFPLKNKLQVALFGMGSSEYNEVDEHGKTVVATMGRPVREAIRHFQKLGARNIVSLKVGDDAIGDHAQITFDAWVEALLQRPRFAAAGSASTTTTTSAALSSNKRDSSCCNQEGNHCECQDNGSTRIEGEGLDNGDDDSYYSQEEDNTEPEVMDMEDLGDAVLASSSQQHQSSSCNEPREMVTPSQAQALKKEGYRLIGTHSAVKMCRWTKHQLRGRGGCYKHTFYGITSYQCMEATPSLACANKCVFCWRHHKNPVGKEWRWKTDDPNFIVDQAVKEHVKMIKEAKGIPGVQLDRWKEAHTVRHCALSLVGEPIMYPRIDEFLADLHRRKISTFLVTNGQHPQAIASLRPITQLYVSVDAPTQESLIAIDRPLFRDAWDRLKESLACLKDKGQRTVARLTVVKGWNSDEIEGYAKLIALGHTSLVEIKGVTFCGKSDASNLNMTNTPWHHEVVELARTLKKELDKIRLSKAKNGDKTFPEYDLACEHKHSVSVLLARVDQFCVVDPVTGTRKWRTWIDYDKFQELAARNAQDPNFTFGVEDYTAETPSWALFGAEEEGFDPTDTRHRKRQKHPKYTQFDDQGIPTHDHNGDPLSETERARLTQLMEERQRQLGGAGSTVTEMRGGAKEIQDASLMFRGLVIVK